MSKVLLFIADGFEEVEGLTVVDLLRRAGIEVNLVSVSDDIEILGSHGIVVTADKIYEEVGFDDIDMLILPGGLQGTKNLSKHKGLIERLKEFDQAEKYIAAICAAPTILGQNGLLRDREATCYPGHEDKLSGATIVNASVVRDGNIITGRSLGGAIDFALELIKVLLDKNAADKVKEQIVY